MFFVYLFILLIGIFVLLFKKDLGWFSLIPSGLIAAMITVFSGLIITETLPLVEKTYSVPIYSAASKDVLNGRFVFGSGTIGSIDKYQTFIKYGNGKKKYIFDSSSVVIVEDNKTSPHIVIAYNEVKKNWWTDLVNTNTPHLNYRVVEMVVPEGSVTTSFRID